MKEKKPTFPLLLFKYFSHLQNFKKICIYTHLIDLSCHQKFEKNSPTGSGNKVAHEVVGNMEKVTVD